ncbi:ABC transporter substrate-binding protein [Dactylosporangium vinaceum]|uniref:ABC transporter substrate-binding protein n=1 Tax=Dactylosporangium vinaceum TaxID=53362 RepID=A0ABV5MKR4_9ACTN|nr:ABC transporter substrate-binding protein [Dactylosporangium vinaceum]UAB93901.1 ABC transporter substrate-binding protein [Dactylosporangium vinaceum]
MSKTPRLDRRAFLKATGATVIAAAGAEVVAGCSSDNAPAAPKAAERLRIASTDPTKGIGVDPRSVGQGTSSMVAYHLYEGLMSLDNDKYLFVLAESAEPNADATKWTVRLRDGVKFHNGQPVKAADVVYSIRSLATPPGNRASVYADVDLAGMKALDARTVEIPLKRPRGDFKEGVLSTFSLVFPDGTTDFSAGIGTGPYKLQSVDGQNVRLTANEAYWGAQPSVRGLEFIRIADPAARLNALKSGEADYVVGISAVGAAAEKGNHAVLLQRGGTVTANALSFAMNQNLAPFNDPRVRRALRLAVDRPQLTKNALLGMASEAQDLVGKGLPGYPTDLGDRSRNIAEARELLKAAGVTQLTIRAADIVPGMLDATRLFGQQLAEAGVTLTINPVPVDSFYADLPGLAKNPFQTFYYANRPAATHLANVTSQHSVFNVTGTGPDYWARLQAAQVIVDDKARATAFDGLQHELYDTGGDILWAYQDQLDASKPGISGVQRRGLLPTFGTAQLA